MHARLVLLTVLAALPLSLLAPVSLHPSSAIDPQALSTTDANPYTMHALAQRYAGAFPLDPIPQGMSAQQRADYILDQHVVMGRTPQQWLDWAHQAYAAQASAAPSPPTASPLEGAILDLYRAAGIAPSPQEAAAAHTSAAGIPPQARGAMADLVATVAQAYAEQRPVADAVLERARAANAPAGPTFLSLAERDAMMERSARIVAAIHRLQDALSSLPQPEATRMSGPHCLAPLYLFGDCLAYYGSHGDDTYASNPPPFPDPILIIDPKGDDTYTDSAGGANPSRGHGLTYNPSLDADGEATSCEINNLLGDADPGAAIACLDGIGPGALAAIDYTEHNATRAAFPGNNLALSVVADYEGDDHYTYIGEPSVVQGAGYLGGMGILVDQYGNDTYLANFTRTDFPPPNIGNVIGNQDGGAQGYGYGGFGLLLDDWGDDVYDFRIASTAGRCVWGWAQGFGGAGGIGISSDLWGNDDWLATGRELLGDEDCYGSGGNTAVLGLYPQGVGILGGVGIMTDTGQGDDDYHAYNTASTPDSYGQGYSVGGLGIMYDDGGTDDFVASETATVTSNNTTLNCAFGSGEAGGVAVLLVGPGDTRYLTETTSNKGAWSMSEGWGEGGYGLFVDRGGVDRHLMYATSGPLPSTAALAGRGNTLGGGDSLFGNYLDQGGDEDAYVGPPFSVLDHFGPDPQPNDSVWDGGADL
jgi:hypothetical protein